jgi:large subunit ribosomal protein L10
MPISRAYKEELVARYVELLKTSNGLVLTQNNGMDMPQFDALRAKMREVGSTYMVTKNTLLKLALKEVGLEVPEELLTGPVVVAFAHEDVGATAKAVLDFRKDIEEVFMVKGAMVDGELYDEGGVKALSELPTIDELHAQLVGLIIAPASGLVNVINSGVSQVVNVVAAYAAKEDDAAEAA